MKKRIFALLLCLAMLLTLLPQTVLFAAAETHSFEATLTTVPTCTADGVRTFVCTDCGSSYTETVPAFCHHYTEQITTIPTASSCGIRTYTCVSCGDQYTEQIPALQVADGVCRVSYMVNGTEIFHSDVEMGAQITLGTGVPGSATTVSAYTSKGYTFSGLWARNRLDHTMTCSGAFGGKYTVTEDVTFHAVYRYSVSDGISSSRWELVKDLSWIEPGEYAILTKEYKAFNGTIKSGHGQMTATAFTFDANGLSTSVPTGICTLQFIPVQGGYQMYHSLNGYLYAKAAKSGNLSWGTSDDAGWSVLSRITHNANGADLSSYEDSIRTYANSYSASACLARKCGVRYGYTTVITPSCAHRHTSTVGAIPAICTEYGYTGDTYCSDCGTVISQGHELIKTSHSYEDGPLVPPTCVEDGYRLRYCTHCGQASNNIWYIYNATGHTDADLSGSCDVCGAKTRIYEKVTDISQLKLNDRIILVNEEYQAAAGEMDTSKFFSSVPACFRDGFATAPKAVELAVGQGSTGLTLTGREGMVGIGGTKLLTLNSGALDWDISITSGGNAIIQSSAVYYGILMYNQNEPRFNLYDYTVKPIQIYRYRLTPEECVAEGGHNEQLVSKKLATCTEQGEWVYRCTVCDETRTEYFPVLGHAYEFHDGQEPTCTQPGYKPYATCSRCDYSSFTEIPALGHQLVTDPAVSATCTQAGLTQGQHCSRCGEVFSSQTEIAPAGHTLTVHPAQAPTCTQAGWNEYETCSVCGYSTYSKIPALGHQLVTDPAIPATCLQSGLTEGQHCARCDYAVAQQEVAALGHHYAATEVTATCTEPGTVSYCCTLCGDIYTEDMPALGHYYVSETLVEASCLEEGLILFTCSRCDDSYLEFPEQLEHSYTAVETAPTCTAEGTITYTCDNCGDTYEETIPALGHDLIETILVAPSCTSKGAARYNCSRCSYTKNAALPITHTYTETVTTPASCIQEGLSTLTCTKCGATAAETIPALGHELTTVPAVPATCTEPGLTAGEYCSRCDYAVAQTQVPALGHDIVTDRAVPAGCASPGLTAGEHCSRCDYAVAQQEVAALGHFYALGKGTPASCTQDGTQCYMCVRCQDTYTEVIPAAHTVAILPTIAPSCSATGIAEFRYCSVCGDILTAQQTVPALGHSFVGGVCTRCGAAEPTGSGDRPAAVTAESVYAPAGSTVSVPIRISDNPGFAGFAFDISCTDGLTLTGVEAGELLDQKTGIFAANGSSISWTAFEDCTDDGVMFILKLKLAYGLPDDSEQYVSVSLRENAPGNFTDHSGTPLSVSFAQVLITTSPIDFGDVNTSQSISTYDAVKIIRRLIGLKDIWTADELAAADVDHDGVITSADAVCVMRYLAGKGPNIHSWTNGNSFRSKRSAASDTAKVFAATVSGEVGDTVTVPVSISDNPGIAGFSLGIDVPQGLTLTGISRGELIPGSLFETNETDGIAVWASTKNITADGELLELSFRIETAGEHTVGITLPEDGFTDENGKTVEPVLESGAVSAGEASLKIASAYLQLKEDIHLIYEASVPESYETPYMVFTYQGTDYTVEDCEIRDGRYCFDFGRINPQCMGDSISATLYAACDGTEYTDTVEEYSVRTYCVNMLAKAKDKKLKTLLSDILTYGAAAQVYTGYRTDEPVTKDLTLMPGTYAPLSGLAPSFSGAAAEDICWTGAGLTLKDSVAMNFRFYAESTDGLNIKVNLNGREKTFTANDFTAVSGLSDVYEISFTGIMADEFADTVSASFFRNGGKTGNTVAYSVNTYICAKQADGNTVLAELVKALYHYGASAAAYAD